MNKQRTPMTGPDHTASAYLACAVQVLDQQFGEGYAKANAAAVAGFMQTRALARFGGLLTELIDQQSRQVAAIEDVAGRIGDCASELESVAVAILEGSDDGDDGADAPHVDPDPLCSRCCARPWSFRPGKPGTNGPAYCSQCFDAVELEDADVASQGRDSARAPGKFSDELMFRIGSDGASLDQLPNFKRLAFHVIGKADGCGLYALGTLIGDAFLKLMRPWPVGTDASYEPDPCSSWLMEIADGLPVSPGLDGMRSAFLFRVGEFLDIATNCPARLPAIFAGIDALTNERLTERCRAILETGRDPGEGDLWRARYSEPAT